MNLNISLTSRKFPPPQDIIIKYTKVSGQCLITWNPTFGVGQEKIFYNVYRATSYTGSFVRINKVPIILNKYIDSTLNVNPAISYWYRVSTLYKHNNTWIEGNLSEPVQYCVNMPSSWFNKINERNLWILRNTGVLVDYYIRQYSGEHCRHCYDTKRGAAGDSHCPYCFGTGYVVPYAPVSQLWVRLNPVEENLSMDTGNAGYIFVQAVNAYTISQYRIRSRDLFISPEGIIYSIVATTINTASGFYFKQDMRLLSIDSNDPIYNMKRAHLRPEY